MKIKNVTVAGTGVLGSQIAFQSAFKGFEVAAYDINDEALEKAKERFKVLQKRYQEDQYGTKVEVEEAYKRISLFTDLEKAVEKADLVIEAVPEVIEIKKEFYKSLSEAAPKDAIFASNSSTMTPSHLVDFTDSPTNYSLILFVTHIRQHNISSVINHNLNSL